MDFDKTSFCVDLYTPGDKYVPKRLSFPKSARISIDDLVSDSPLSFCFSPVDAFVDTPFELARGWTNSAPLSPLVPLDRDPYQMYDQDPKKCEETLESAVDWRKLATPGLLSVADDCASCGVDLDVSCLDTLDEQLLLSPVGCFSELCWEAAVCDEFTAPVNVKHRSMRSRTLSFKCDYDRAFSPPPPLGRDYPGSFDRMRPLAARIRLPLEVFPHYLGSPTSRVPTREPHATTLMFEKQLPYIPKTDPEGRLLLPVQGMPIPRRSKKRDQILTCTRSGVEPRSQPSTPTKSSQPFRALSDVFTRSRRQCP